MESRPKWEHESWGHTTPFPLTEDKFTELSGFMPIITLEACSVQSGNNLYDHWLEVTDGRHDTLRLGKDWPSYLAFSPDDKPWGLFKFTSVGNAMMNKLKDIKAWDKEYTEERKEYERLKAKFEGE